MVLSSVTAEAASGEKKINRLIKTYLSNISKNSFQEIADILGIEKKKVYKKYYAALSYIKQKV